MPSFARILGPFIGFTDATSTRIWLHQAGLKTGEANTIYVTIHPETPEADRVGIQELRLVEASLWAAIVEFRDLKPNSLYYYKLWSDATANVPFGVEELQQSDLHLRTLPPEGMNERVAFLLMSCHNPTVMTNDGCNGFRMWTQIPKILAENPDVRFAVLGGDQIYADEVTPAVLRNSKNPLERRRLYLDTYYRFWSNVHYRKILCSLPSVLMWDDHDITDGWGSRLDSFNGRKSEDFKDEWKALKETATECFEHMQSIRNPPPINRSGGYDYCFKVGRSAFVVPDLSSNRNQAQGNDSGRNPETFVVLQPGAPAAV